MDRLHTHTKLHKAAFTDIWHSEFEELWELCTHFTKSLFSFSVNYQQLLFFGPDINKIFGKSRHEFGYLSWRSQNEKWSLT